MSVSICTSCLSKLRIHEVATRTAAVFSLNTKSTFHTTTSQQNVVKKKSVTVPGTRVIKSRESRSARIKKKGREKPKLPAIGERKAQRKRVVLSNTNALDVSEIQTLSASDITQETNAGKVVALDGELLDQLRDAKAFKTTQNWSSFRTPSVLFRQETATLGKDIAEIRSTSAQGVSAGKTIQKIVTGSRGTGKSVHLLQAMSMAYLNKWIVINVPEAQDFIINQSPFAPVPETDDKQQNQQMYIQPALTSELLTRIAYSNANVLSKLKPIHNHGKSLKSIKINSLKDMAILGAEEPAIAPLVWDALWKELTVKNDAKESDSATRPPILIAIDGIDHWMGLTKYRSAEYNLIHAHQFTLIRQFLHLLFTKEQLSMSHGGMVLAATTASNNPSFPSFNLLIDQLVARAQGLKETDSNFPMPDPYAEVDQRVFDLLSRSQYTQLEQMKGLSRGESKGLLEFFARSGILREAITETSIGEKWSLSGGGIVGELCKLGKRVRFSDLATKSNQSSRIRV